jgi:hypothetical protein
MQSGTGSSRQGGPTLQPGFPPRNADLETAQRRLDACNALAKSPAFQIDSQGAGSPWIAIHS